MPSSVSTSTTTKVTTTTIPRIIYRVKRGDSLTRIANQFRVSIAAIVARNHIANPDRLSEGQTLVIPPYAGDPYTASADGAVTATYQTDLAGPTGIYHVTATGNLGTTVQASFVLVAPASIGSP